MKIGDAAKIYSAQLKDFWEQKRTLAKQKKDLEEKMKASPEAKDKFADEAATLELTYHKVSDQYDVYHDFMEKLREQQTAYFNAEVSKQQGEAMKEYAEDLGKIMEVARRISHGDKVPGSDEKKLMEYSMEMYMAAKNLGAAMKHEKRKEYESLWDDEEEKPQNPDPEEVANNAEFSGDLPEVVSIGEICEGE